MAIHYILGLFNLYFIGAVGWQLFKILRIPSAPVLGSMTFVGLAQIYDKFYFYVPVWLNPVLQTIVGISIGVKITKEIYCCLKSTIIPVILTSLWWLIVSLLTGYVFYKLGFFDAVTSFLGCASGGITEMGLIAVSLHANPSQVVTLQFFRLMGIVIFTPFICRLLSSSKRLLNQDLSKEEEINNQANSSKSNLGITTCGSISTSNLKAQLLTYLLGLFGGVLLYLTGFPAGGLVGAFLTLAVARLLGLSSSRMPNHVAALAQVGIGGIIGLNISSETIQLLINMAWPVILLTFLMLLNGFILSLIIRKLTGWDIQTCVLSTCAGGLTQVAMIAEELGANAIIVTVLQLFRLLTIIIVLPTLILFW